MAQYQVTYSCGHESWVNLYGKETDRRSKIEWMESDGLCEECLRAKHEAETEIAKAQNPELPPLQGSEKQIIWAETLRAKALVDLKKYAECALKRIDELKNIDNARKEELITQMGQERFEQEVKAAIARELKLIAKYENAKQEVSASWWIQNYR